MSKKEIQKIDHKAESGISRRQALQKMGYAAFASSTMFVLLNNPTKVYAASPSDPDPGDFFDKSGESESSDDKNTDNYNDPWKQDDDPWK